MCQCPEYILENRSLSHLACSTSCLECSYSALGLSSRKGLQTLEKWLSRPMNVAWSHLGLSMSTGEGISSLLTVSPRPLTSAMRAPALLISGRGFRGIPLFVSLSLYSPVSQCLPTDWRKTQSGENAKPDLFATTKPYVYSEEENRLERHQSRGTSYFESLHYLSGYRSPNRSLLCWYSQ